MWKGPSLVSVNKKMDTGGEEVTSISTPPNTNDRTMRVETADSSYDLGFDGNFYRLDPVNRPPEHKTDEETVEAEFPWAVSCYKIRSRGKRDYLFINFEDKNPEKVFIYRVNYTGRRMFKPAGSIKTGNLQSLNISRDPETERDLLLAGTKDGRLRIFVLKGRR